MDIKRKEFSRITDCFGKLKTICPEVNMSEGIIRQKFNNGAGMVSIDLTEIIPEDNTFNLVNLSRCVDIMGNFNLGAEEEIVSILPENGYLTIKDDYTDIDLKLAADDASKKTFMTPEEFAKSVNANFHGEANVLLGEFELTIDNTYKRFKSLGGKVSDATFEMRIDAEGDTTLKFISGVNEKASFKNLFKVEDTNLRDMSIVFSIAPFIVDYSDNLLIRCLYSPANGYGKIHISSKISDLKSDIYLIGMNKELMVQ